MLFKGSIFHPVSRQNYRQSKFDNLKSDLIDRIVTAIFAYSPVNGAYVVKPDAKEGIEFSTGCIVLNHDDYAHVVNLLLKLAGGKKQNETYKKIRALMETPYPADMTGMVQAKEDTHYLPFEE